MRIHVDLHQTENPDGWFAAVALTRKAGKNEIALGESIIYQNRETAWNSIQKEVQGLDYENDEIFFNHKPVKDYNELEKLLEAL